MHANQVPLLEMIDRLGLTPDMSGAVRAIVGALGPDEVAKIRAATLEMLDRAENAMPVDCNLTWDQINSGEAVKVAVVDESGTQTIRVRPAS